MAPATKQRTTKRRGGTLIEGLVAAAVVGLSIAALVSMYLFVIEVTQRNDRVSMAYSVGRQAMEEIKIMGFEHAPEGVTYRHFDGDGNEIPSEDLASVTPKMTVRITVTTQDPIYRTHVASGTQTLVDGLREALVEVIFSQDSDQPEFSLTGILSRSGL